MQSHEIFETNENDILKSWIKSVIKPDDIAIIELDFKNNASLLIDIPCRKIAFIHSHQDFCGDTKYLTQSDDFDDYVFLTNLQKEDFKSINNKVYQKSHLLPHPCHSKISAPKKSEKIITITRFTNNKPIAPAIQAFSKIAHKFPKLIYEIYGIGPEKENIEKIIAQENLKDRVFLRGYTNEAIKKFEEAQLSISLTSFEGFGLSILESLSMSCPVITSDVKYGPNELVKHGFNGFLIKNNDVESIADSMMKILSSPLEFQSNSYNSVSDYSLNAWEEKLNTIIAGKSSFQKKFKFFK